MLCGQIIVCMTVTSHNSLASFNSLCCVLSLQPLSRGYMVTDRWPSLFLTALPIVCKKVTCWVVSIRERHLIDGGWVMISQSGMRFRTLGGNESREESWHCRSTAQFSVRWGWEAPGNCGSCSVFSHLHVKAVCTRDLMYFFNKCYLVTWELRHSFSWFFLGGVKQLFPTGSMCTPHGYLIRFKGVLGEVSVLLKPW